ncbi:magnesium transporter, partial [Scytonema millei VB511283_2]
MLTQEGRIALTDITDLNLLKAELNRLPPVDAGDYIAELSPQQQAIAFRLLNKN